MQIDWTITASMATALGTLVLAIATFGATRSANRSARLAEIALQEQLRPVLVHSLLDDPQQKIGFHDDHWVRVPGGGAAVDYADGNIYLALSLRNVGAGIGVLQGWHVWPSFEQGLEGPVPLDWFRKQMRDLYIPAGGIGLWQGALRDNEESDHGEMANVAGERRRFLIDLLYTDHMGHQRTISRFSVTPVGDDRWINSVVRHWNIDRPGPR